MAYDLRLDDKSSPGVLTTSAGYIYDTARSSSHKRVYSWRGAPVNRKAFHNHHFSFSETHLELNQTYYTGTSWVRGSVLHPGAHGLQLWDPIPYSDLYARLLDKLNEQTRSSLDLSVDLAEAGSTARMFNALDHLDQFHRSFFSTRKLSRLLEATKWAGQQWLIYTYGVRPLISSIHGAADESVRVVLNATQRYKVRVSESKATASVSMYLYSGRYSVPLPSKGTNKRSLQIILDLATPSFDLARWTSLNPVSLGYELIPFSFVLDWVIDIGSFIRNYETALLYNSRFRGGIITDLSVLDVDCQFAESQPYGWTTVYNGNASSRSIIRSILSEYPVPRLPTFSADMGSSRLLSSASLLSQFLNKRS